MSSADRRKTTAVGADGVRVTDYQIRSGHFVVPIAFFKAHKDSLVWGSGFDVVAFGTAYGDKKIDEDRRLNIRLREQVVPGDIIRLRIEGRTLHVARAEGSVEE